MNNFSQIYSIKFQIFLLLKISKIIKFNEFSLFNENIISSAHIFKLFYYFFKDEINIEDKRIKKYQKYVELYDLEIILIDSIKFYYIVNEFVIIYILIKSKFLELMISRK